jgi:uncharacterized Zn-finger protein
MTVAPNDPGDAQRSDPQLDVETETVSDHRVSCDGGGGALGHPKVYLEMGEKGRVECPYCDKVFVLAK